MKEKEQTPPEVSSEQPTKMRIKLYKEGSLISDRLVEQVTEMAMGPKTVHKGPMSLEFNLRDQAGIEAIVEYLRKLKGDLPILEVTKKKTDKKLSEMLSEKEPLLDLVNTLKAKATTQEKLIEMLREYQFIFTTWDYINDLQDGMETPYIDLPDKYKDYQFMIRKIKEAKDPINDKFDFRLTVAIKIIGDKVDLVKIFLFGKWSENLKIPWEKKKNVNFKKVEKLYSFPEFMDIADRKKWRQENRKWEIATNKGQDEAAVKAFEFSKSFIKYKPYVKVH